MKPYFWSVCLAVTVSMAWSAGAISFTVASLETNPEPDADPEWFDVDLDLNGDGTATFSIGNLVADGNGTRISDIWLGTETTLGNGNNAVTTDHFFSFFDPGSGVVGGVGFLDYQLNENPNPNGPADWAVQLTADAQGGEDGATVNPGEEVTITYDLVDPTTEQELIDAFLASPPLLGLAFHVQAITDENGDGDYSEKYKAIPTSSGGGGGGNSFPVPDGGVTLILLGMSFLGYARFRKHR